MTLVEHTTILLKGFSGTFVKPENKQTNLFTRRRRRHRDTMMIMVYASILTYRCSSRVRRAYSLPYT